MIFIMDARFFVKSKKESKKMQLRFYKIIFIVACVGILCYAWLSWLDAFTQYKNEAFIIPTILLYIITFPLSLLVQLAYTSISSIIPIDQFNIGTLFLNWLFKTWLPLFVVGYLQWFVLIPYLRHKQR